ncbi:Dyp-type peroxidase [Agromyces cerinus]|uniref:Dye decolorizing peroxidase n=1 Tax=Agromyces cerinus subsp. cerinus TaxID=232089 RepID=A0A1N6EVF4_9MICO|nr:Dyp-type peroxidase [Agromyces cerinus]SIN86960.1 dye decolorizing peroxidase [Agromyces cerinus subsp. cerinus]
MTGEPGGSGFSRRHLLFGGAAAAGAGAAVALGASAAIRAGVDAAGGSAADGTGAAVSATAVGEAILPFHGVHQAGIETPPQSHAVFIALDLLPEVDAAALRRMLRVLSDDVARVTQGRAPLADTEPELAEVPARLTVTFGFGPGLVARAGAEAPSWLRPLPPFGIDRLDPRWNDGDLLLQIGADDAVTVSHAARMLLKDARSFATVRWTQRGFRRAAGSEPDGRTMRNLFGQLDGTVNPKPGTADFDELVWSAGEPAWMAGGTSMVLRRIAMDLDGWDRVDRPGREASVGRKLASGAPLTGKREHDEPDFEALGPVGFPVIPDFSHLRRSRSDVPGERIFRRGYNYDEAPAGASVSDAGLLFASFQADVDRQFVPIQRRLDELDLLNEWTTPVGSAVFAIPPGCAEGGYIGDTLV